LPSGVFSGLIALRQSPFPSRNIPYVP
jgi:hypothetical protein